MHRYFTRSRKRRENSPSNSSSGSTSSRHSINSQEEICDFSEQSFASAQNDPDLERLAIEFQSELHNQQHLLKVFSSESENSEDNPSESEDLENTMPANNPDAVPQQNNVRLDKEFVLKFIPEFSGKRDELHKFITCCDVIDGDYNEEDKKMLLNIIRSKMTGSAYNISKYKTFNSWSELKIILQDQFLELKTLTQIQTDLVNCKQNFRENVRSFANRIEKLLADLNDACVASEGQEAASVIISLNNKTALKAFVDGLQPSIRLIIKASRFDKLSAAIEAAVEEEKSIAHNSKSVTKPHSNSKCSFCHKVGHTSTTCFLKPNTSLPRIPQNQKIEIKKEPLFQNLSVRILKCSYCKTQGHHIKDCRKKAHNDSKRNQNSQNNVTQNANLGNDNRPGANGGPIRARDLQQNN